jgi:dTDP-4-dehydrorhamnose reductase
MKILFFGHKGWLGQMIVEKWKHLRPEDTLILSATRVDNNNFNTLTKEISQVDIVVSTVGRTSGGNIPNIDYLEDNLFENIRDNLQAPIILANICKSLNIHLTYMGTGCIFSSDTRKDDVTMFTEDDCPNFFGSGYSIVKGFTDNLMKSYDNVLNLRIRMPIIDSDHPKDFISKILKFEKICSYPNSMTHLPTIIPCIIEMTINKKTGTYNMTNSGSISHKEIIDLYNQYKHSSHICEYIEQDELKHILKSKRSNNILDQTKLQSLFPDLPDIKTCIINSITSR